MGPRFLLSLQRSYIDRPYVIHHRDVPCIEDYKCAYVTISVTGGCFVYNILFWVAVTCSCPNVALESVKLELTTCRLSLVCNTQMPFNPAFPLYNFLLDTTMSDACTAPWLTKVLPAVGTALYLSRVLEGLLSPISGLEILDSIPAQCVWNFWLIIWNWDRFFCEYLWTSNRLLFTTDAKCCKNWSCFFFNFVFPCITV